MGGWLHIQVSSNKDLEEHGKRGTVKGEEEEPKASRLAGLVMVDQVHASVKGMTEATFGRKKHSVLGN